jgi:hypothetical protein
MWNVIQYNDFKRLISNYDKINLVNYNVNLFFVGNNDSISKATFDGLVDVYFIHYHQDNGLTRTIKRSIDVISNDILSYTGNKIKKRLSRLLEKNEPPVFIFETRDRSRFDANYTPNDVYDFINLDTKYKKIVLTSFAEFKRFEKKCENCHVIYYDDKHPELPPDTLDMAKCIYNNCKEVFDNE